MALHEKSALRGGAVVGNETRMRNRVAIEKNQVIAARRGNRQIQNTRAAEALMFLPDMLAAKGLLRAPLLKHGFGFIS